MLNHSVKNAKHAKAVSWPNIKTDFTVDNAMQPYSIKLIFLDNKVYYLNFILLHFFLLFFLINQNQLSTQIKRFLIETIMLYDQ